MPTYGGTLTPTVAWMPSASPAVSCGGRTSSSITSTACPPPPPELPLALGVHALPIPTGDLAAAVPSQLPHRIFLRGQGGVGRFGNCR